MGYTKIEALRRTYKPGDRIEIVHMEDMHGVPPGTQGTVDYVDDAGNIHMLWDNGSRLALIEEIDKFKRLS